MNIIPWAIVGVVSYVLYRQCTIHRRWYPAMPVFGLWSYACAGFMLDGLFHRGFLSLEGIIGAGSSVLCLMATAEFLAGLRYMKQSPIQQFQEDSVAVALGGERDYWTNSPWESLDDNTSSDHKTA